jgi:hypothetical protein
MPLWTPVSRFVLPRTEATVCKGTQDRQATRAYNKLRPRRLSLNPWREIAAKEIHQSRPSAARVSLSIENKVDCPPLTRVFGVGHIVAFPHSVIFEVDILKGESEIVWLNNHQTAIVQSSVRRDS